MKIVIEHLQVKRELNGSGFNICGTKEDLLRIADQIKERAEHEFAFGWVTVRDSQPDEHSAGPRTASLPWA